MTTLVKSKAVDLPVLSRYRIEALVECNAWEPEKSSSEAARFGTAFHTAAELFVAGESENEDDATQQAIRATAGFPVGRECELRAMVGRWARDYVAYADAQQTAAFLDERSEVVRLVEADIWREIPGVANVHGIIDRLDLEADDMTIIDYKTTWMQPPLSVPFQLMFYAGLAFPEHPEMSSASLRQEHVRIGRAGEWRVTRDEVEAWWTEMSARLADALGRKATPTGGSACRWCAKRWSCSDATPVNAHTPKDDVTAESVVAELVRLEAAADARKSALKEYMVDRTPAVFAGCEVGYSESAPSVRVTDKAGALSAGFAKETPGSIRFTIKKAKA